MESDSASPTESSHPAEGDVLPDNGSDLEHDEANEGEIHDLALAVETSGISSHGHEVTFPPSNDDQNETMRIVTEAIAEGEDGQALEAMPRPTSRRKRPRMPTGLLPTLETIQEKRQDPSGEVH